MTRSCADQYFASVFYQQTKCIFSSQFQTTPTSFLWPENPLQDDFIVQQIQPKQHLNYLSLSSTWQWYDPLVKEIALNTYLTTDAFNTNEVEVDFSTKLQLLLGGVSLTLLPEVTYLTTSFEDDFYTRTAVDYNAGNARLSFFVSKIRGKFKFKAGAKGAYGIGNEFDETALFCVPRIGPFLSPTERKFCAVFKYFWELEAKQL